MCDPASSGVPTQEAEGGPVRSRYGVTGGYEFRSPGSQGSRLLALVRAPPTGTRVAFVPDRGVASPSQKGGRVRSIEILRGEHKLILRSLDVVQAILQGLAAGEAPSVEDLTDLLDFLEGFGDRIHNRKEEFLLFPWLRNHGIPIQIGPVACMDLEHQRLRLRLRRLRQLRPTEPDDQTVLRAELSELESEMRHHIQVEDTQLYRIAEDHERDDSELLEAFREAIPDAVEQERDFRNQLERLEGRFGLPGGGHQGIEAES